MGAMIRCLQCMQEYDSQYDICPYCGSEKGIRQKDLYYLPPGTMLKGRYEVGASIGGGGFGLIYKAWDHTLAKIVAIKEYYPTGIVNRVPGEKEVIVYSGRREREYTIGKVRFLEEARTIAKYNTHDNIVNIYDFFEENNTAYMVMEFLDGMNFREYLKNRENSRVSVQEALKVLHPVLVALAEVHKSNILHRDISPDNIFLCRDGRVKLIDFGAARLSSTDETINVTVILKPGYAPPEQYQSKGRQGPWIDIYALGATLYRAVTGTQPEESVNRAVKKNEPDNLIPPENLCPEISHNLNNAILRAMAIQPELRFQSAEEFWDAISGEAEVRDVEKELKRRKIRRFVSITAVSAAVLAGIFICMRVMDQRKAAAAILEPAEITMWVRADSEETAEEKLALMEEALESFREEYPHVTVTLTCMEEPEYETKLRDAMDRGNLPTVFDSSCLGPEEYEGLWDFTDLFDFIQTGDYWFFNRYEDFFPGEKQLPLSFSMPVVYYCTLANPEEKSVEELVAEGNFMVSSGGYFTWYNLYGGGEPVEDFRDWSGAAAGKDRICDGEDFLRMETACLLADSSRYEWIQRNLPGIYEVGFWQEKGMAGAFRDYYSITEEASGEEKAAALQVLVYLLADQAQDILYVQNGKYLPLNRKVYDAYVEINTEFAGLDAGMDRVMMAGEYQAALDKWFAEIQEKTEKTGP